MIQKLMSKPEATKRKIAIAVASVIFIFIVTVWISTTGRSITISYDENKDSKQEFSPNSPLTVLKNMGSSLMGVIRGESVSAESFQQAK
ncbi:MAG: hypothetical protein COV07_01250 [Candidatus Vogelbacteria bacterium CG10_big_fil_rev_8_21_14_0_10_45_14]|uniref:Uncharacterized protein n=1 Tax=Candidatus Vogelbacteria bacterium CG10_big_fil_rev_8_21_14_0_10_45_14 TaxID=1975042 RepID=A0A2H0RKQ9_9BACT|nr:MAG: hypothetical protein COV07_01250 [Candidatus Vogelbacteria bacterium CG10_big_fil_rev_8_21_14_0_10_45_14]